jgi:primary-amine oxidase
MAHTPLSTEELAASRRVLEESGKVTGSTRFALVLLDEDAAGRRVRSTLLDIGTGAAAEALVDLTAEQLTEWRELDPASTGQPPVLQEEYERCDALVKADPGWLKAMAARGITDLDHVIATPLSAGNFGIPGETGRRVLRSLTFLLDDEEDNNPWAHPVEGLMADVDIIEGRVIRLLDQGIRPVPTESGRYDAAHTGPARDTLRPLQITQPEGPSFSLDGNLLTWDGWSVRIGFNAREGLTLHQLAHSGRPVLDRASIAEMAVPYADPDPTRNWICYFDAGEYSLGRNANALRLGCDCLGEIRYLDAVMADDQGRPYTAENAVCIHEEDTGLAWKHTNIFSGKADSRRGRRLVISFIATVGNYDYGFYWYLHLDGSIAFEAKATGVVFTAAGDESPYATKIAPDLLAPHHQHLFCARLDPAVDGPGTTVEEIDLVRVPTGPENPCGNAFTTRATPITGSAEPGRTAETALGRRWRISSSEAVNRLGSPTAYTLIPQPGPTLLAQPESSLAARAAFATRHLWVTERAADRRHPAGEYPNQHPGGAGLPEWTDAGSPAPGSSLTLWHVFGPTHIPRPEDWPVMPVDSAGFHLKPTGFFDRNPALTLPEQQEISGEGHCHS